MNGSRPAVGGGVEVLAALTARPGAPELLALAEERTDLALVGGAVRDLLLGREPRELDVVVAGDAASLAEELVSRLRVSVGDTVSVATHERFGTAVVRWEGGQIDLAERRAESYPAPGALPEVRPGSEHEDLARRDFTVNALAVALAGPERGELSQAGDALEDLRAGVLRVLHDRSFIDDPTRLLRLARYGARLGFEPETHTALLARRALDEGALATISRARIGAELRLALSEPQATAVLAAMGEQGVLAAVAPGLRFDRELADRASSLLPEDGRRDLLLMVTLVLHLTMLGEEEAEQTIFAILDELEFTAADRERVLRGALVASRLVGEMVLAERPSQLRAALGAHTPEAVALAGALGGDEFAGAEEAARRWFGQVRPVRLEITGQDLLDAGIPSGPEIGRRLEAVLARRLDGEIAPGREAEIAAALRDGS